MLIDSHCHLDFFPEEEVPGILARAEEMSVQKMLTIGVGLQQSAKAVALADRHQNVWASVGIHPDHVAEESENLADLPAVVEKLTLLTEHPKVIGIGECGLDYFHPHAHQALQMPYFRAQIDLSRKTGLPLIIHSRNADQDMAAILKEETEKNGTFPFLMHCFSSSEALMQAALALNGYISFSGILTFKKATELRDMAAKVPADRLLVETDAPYLAPEPYRGKQNEPAFVSKTAQILARVRGLADEACRDLTTANFYRLFKKAG